MERSVACICDLGGHDTFTDKFPTFQLEDELLLEERRDVMYGHTYARRRRARDVRRAEQAAKAHAQQVSG